MDRTAKNKVIAAFMGITWYDSFVECRNKKLALYDELRLSRTDKAGELWALIEATHQHKPEYDYSYDRLIQVMRRLETRIHEIFGVCQFYTDFCERVVNMLWTYERVDLFDHLYETIIHFNQLTKDGTTGNDRSPAQENGQPGRPVQGLPKDGSTT